MNEIPRSERADELLRELSEQADELGDNLLCRNAPDLFFPEFDSAMGMKGVALAKAACRECPLTVLCAEYAIEAREEYGIWGGFTPFERRTIRSRYRQGRRGAA